MLGINDIKNVWNARLHIASDKKRVKLTVCFFKRMIHTHMSICESLLSGSQPSLSARGFTLDLINCCHKIKRYLLYNISYKEMNALAPWNTQGCVSRPNSKSGFLIRKQIFRFFAKIQKRIIDPNDPQWRWILWIILIWIYYPKRFLYYGSEKSKYCQR